MMITLPELPPAPVTHYCLRNGYTDPQKADGQWWAYPPPKVVSVQDETTGEWISITVAAFSPNPLPYMAKGLKDYPTPYTLKITLTYGVLTYRINAGAIVSATWEPNKLCRYQFPHLTFSVGLDLLEVDKHSEVKWRSHFYQTQKLPDDWRCEQDRAPGLVVRAIALSIQYLFDEDLAA